MRIFQNPPRENWAGLCRRDGVDYSGIRPRVEAILSAVRAEGDAALKRLSLEIDGVEAPLELDESDIEAALKAVPRGVKDAVRKAKRNIEVFHEAQRPAAVRVCTSPGVFCEQRPVPLNKVGLYIPGGSAPLFSTVLMLAVPAALAGCRERILCTPCSRSGDVSPEVVFAAKECGVGRIFRIGGAQAVAAMAYGTGTVPKVDKIFGPGNPYVTLAKQIVSLQGTAIDMPAGPSEVLVMADESSNPVFAAADLLSQAEHGADSTAVLVCSSLRVAEDVFSEVARQADLLPRASQVSGALSHSYAVVLGSREEMLAFAEEYAPEHLIISMADAGQMAERITSAGSVFVGPWSPESAGDYASGTNHTLPTGGWARSLSGVNMDSFYRKMTVQQLSREGLEGLAPVIRTMAEAEGLLAHSRAVSLRLNQNE
ncbi:MAG: histidinol dehydrogenase [Bacteroidales bacterium]|nr:histidinol dehydrogenase [Bacteroidales bacterium]